MKLRKENGEWTENRTKLHEITNSFFQDLYCRDESVTPHEIMRLFSPKITEEMNATLVKNFMAEEIGDALFQIGPLKAPGCDGFPARFFQRNWATVREDMIWAVQS